MAITYYDSGELTDNTQRTVQDTEAIQGPSVNETNVISTEDITNFGRVYKSSSVIFLTFKYNYSATLGVAFMLRWSDTKPTGTDDAKNYGTLALQCNANQDCELTFTNVPANRYYWFSLSGGGSRDVNKRNTQVLAAYETAAPPAPTPTPTPTSPNRFTLEGNGQSVDLPKGFDVTVDRSAINIRSINIPGSRGRVVIPEGNVLDGKQLTLQGLVPYDNKTQFLDKVNALARSVGTSSHVKIIDNNLNRIAYGYLTEVTGNRQPENAPGIPLTLTFLVDSGTWTEDTGGVAFTRSSINSPSGTWAVLHDSLAAVQNDGTVPVPAQITIRPGSATWTAPNTIKVRRHCANILTNSAFRNQYHIDNLVGNPENFIWQGISNPEVIPSLQRRDGANAILLSNNVSRLVQQVPTNPSTIYEVSCYAITPAAAGRGNTPGTLQQIVEYYTAGGSRVGNRDTQTINNIPTAHTWTRYKYQFTTQSNSDYTRLIWNAASGTVILTDFMLSAFTTKPYVDSSLPMFEPVQQEIKIDSVGSGDNFFIDNENGKLMKSVATGYGYYNYTEFIENTPRANQWMELLPGDNTIMLSSPSSGTGALISVGLQKRYLI